MTPAVVPDAAFHLCPGGSPVVSMRLPDGRVYRVVGDGADSYTDTMIFAYKTAAYWSLSLPKEL